MNNLQLVAEFWTGYLETLPQTHRHRLNSTPEAWSFGNNKHLANELVSLVVTGIKTATCSRYLGGNTLDLGDASIIADGNGIPQCVVETYEVTIRRFDEIDAGFAAEEGEGDQSLRYWREAHWEFFTKEAETEGYAVNEQMLLACERFRVLYLNPKVPVSK